MIRIHGPRKSPQPGRKDLYIIEAEYRQNACPVSIADSETPLIYTSEVPLPSYPSQQSLAHKPQFRSYLPSPLLLTRAVDYFSKSIALCDPVPQRTVEIVEVHTEIAKASTGSSTPTITVPSTGCVPRITGTSKRVPGIGKVRYRTEPSGRGTIGILISCTATYIFCVWTTVHPAVGETGKKKLRVWYKLVLTSIAIIVPAGVMIYAFDEWRQAKRLRDEWNECVKYHPKPKGSAQGPPPKGPATALADRKDPDDFVELQIGTAFFVLMGGFRIDNKHAGWTHTKKERKKKKKNNMGDKEAYERPILSPQGFVEYVRSGRIHQSTFNQADILDKGKGSHIAKIFAGLQALWLILQSIARLADHLPLTVLEIHVLIQIVCTSVIYAFWFRKPLDVGVPTTIKLAPALGKVHTKTPQSPGSTTSPTFTYAGGETINSRTGTPSPSPFFRSDTRASRMTGSSYNGNDAITITSDGDDYMERLSENEKNKYIDGPPEDEKGKDMGYQLAVAQPLKPAGPIQSKWLPITAKAFLDVVVHVRPLEKAKINNERQPESRGKGESERPALLHNRSTTWTKRIKNSETGFTAMMVVAQGLLVVLVATLHLSAWNTEFPTDVEKWLWLASCFSMIAFPTWIVAVICFNDYDHDLFDILWLAHLEPGLNPARVVGFALKKIHEAIERHSCPTKATHSDNEKGNGSTPIRKAKMVQHYIMLYSCLFAAGVYVLASLFITVESYFAMRWLEDKHFQAPRWTNLVPHF